MATRRTINMKTYMWYGVYAIAAYYGYNWWANRAIGTTTVVTVPPGTR